MGSDVLHIAARQYGLLSRDQAGRDLGLSDEAIRWLTRSGAWEAVLPGVLGLCGHPPSFERDVLAATLWGGGCTAASHRCAAALWKFRGFSSGLVEISSPKNRLHLPTPIVVHRHLPVMSAVTPWGVIPATNRLLTLLELGCVVSPPLVERALDDQLLEGHVSLRGLWWILDEHGGRGRRGAGTMRALLRERDPRFAPPEGDLEADFLDLILSGGLPKPESQVEVRGPDGRPYYIDFAYPRRKVAIELDGYIWHAAKKRFQKDHNKQNVLVAQGWRVLRFTWYDVHERPEYVLATIAAVL